MRQGVGIACVVVVAAVVAAVGMIVQPAAPADVSPAVPTPATVSRPRIAPVAKAPRATVPDAPTPAVVLPSAYRVLLARSIFCPRPVVRTAGTASAESSLTLRGIIQLGTGFAAFVENTASGEARQVHVGDTVGHGKLIGIDLLGVEYEAGKRAMRVAVGQTFNGQVSSAGTMAQSVATTHTFPD